MPTNLDLSQLIQCNSEDLVGPVLVTGATGYVAGVLIQHLLIHGITVHGTVRTLNDNNTQTTNTKSNSKSIDYLQQMANGLPGTLQLFAADLLVPNSFCQAMQGCRIVFHTASPFTNEYVPDVYQHFLRPAVEGTTNVLHQACQTPTVRRVVMTSSVTTMCTDAADHAEAPGGIIREDCWNHTASLHHIPYAYSKSMAERAAWVIAGSQNQWTLVTINPSLVLGPGLKYHDQSESFKTIQKMGNLDISMIAGAPDIGMGMVDVRDVAEAHLVAAYAPSRRVSGRYILNAHNSSIAELALCLHRLYPDYPIPSIVAPVPRWIMCLGEPMSGMSLGRRFFFRNAYHKVNFDHTKSVQDLSMKYRPMEETLRDMFEQLIQAGAVQPRKGFFY